jgi:serine O-acetyltransferase
MAACSELLDYVTRQLNSFFPDGEPVEGRLAQSIERGYERTIHCVRRLRTFANAGSKWNPLYSDHYLLFLYYFSNQVYRDFGHCSEATKLYYLNKSLHAFDAFYDIELPPVLGVAHGVGTVLGRARYSDYLYVYQNVTVGVGLDGGTPEIAEDVVLFPGAKVIGRCRIRENVLVSPNTLLMDRDVPAGHTAAGSNGSLVVRPTKRIVRQEFFR